MEALQDLLNHPYLIKRELTAAVYEVDNKATYTRLLSRSNGKHRFTEEEYKKLVQALKLFAKKLRQRAARLEEIHGGTAEKPRSLLATIRHPLLNLKQMALSFDDANTTGDRTYYQQYDRLRQRTEAPELPQLWSEKLVNFADHIEEQLAAAKKQAHTYRFSAGKGSPSHLDYS